LIQALQLPAHPPSPLYHVAAFSKSKRIDVSLVAILVFARVDAATLPVEVSDRSAGFIGGDIPMTRRRLADVVDL